jgi:hypothetical protein
MQVSRESRTLMTYRYLLPESTVVIDGKVDLIKDTRLGGEPRVYLGEPVSTVATGVRADSSHGVRELDPPERGDNALTVAQTGDQRLAGLTFNSVGVGSKVVGAGVKVVAMVLGAAVRAAGVRSITDAAEGLLGKSPTEPPAEDDVRAAWEQANEPSVAHRKAYAEMADAATAQLLAARKTMSTEEDPLAVARAARRVQYLTDLLADANAEVAKVEGLYDAWGAARMEKYPQHITFTLAIDELPEHPDPMSYRPASAPATSASGGGGSVVQHIWDTLGVLVEIGPVNPQTSWRPNAEGRVQGTLDEQSVHWRTPRSARLWIWRRDSDDKAVLEQISDILVTDRYSTAGCMKLEGRYFGERAVDLVLNDLGVPTKLVTGDKSAVGAIADAISTAPEQFTAGLDAVSKASTTLGDLSSAGAELRLKAIKRDVEQRTQELELQGINATAEDFAELKRLKQKVDIATAQGSLAPPSELAKLEAELSRETTQRDLEAVRRDRAQAAEMAAVHSEIDRLKAELELIRIRREAGVH